jgi:undecaprenyl-diphosphatase
VAIFRWINEGWSCHAFDRFFSYITDYHHFEILILFLLLVLLLRGGKKGRWVVLALVLTVILTDQISAHVFKGIFDRVRPCNALSGVLTPDDKPGSFSFPSSHATNMGGSMTLLALAYPPWAWLCAVIAFLVGLSRVYLGVHYPSDVLGGWLLGAAIGWFVWKIVGKVKVYFQPPQPVPEMVSKPIPFILTKSPRKVKRGRKKH